MFLIKNRYFHLEVLMIARQTMAPETTLASITAHIMDIYALLARFFHAAN